MKLTKTPPPSLRPTSLRDYLGQDHLKEPLTVAIESAKKRKAALGHVMLSGPPGLGKTTLSLIIANEMQWKMVQLLGSTAGSAKFLQQQFLELRRADEPVVIFIDEIHALRKPVQEVLYTILEDRRLMFRVGSKVGYYDLPPITVIGATTDLGKLAQPFIDRFPLQFNLVFYEVDELVDIGMKSSEKLGIGITDRGLEVVAERSRGTPRHLNNFLLWVRDYAIHSNLTYGSPIPEQFVEGVLWKKLRIDSRGLRPIDRAYLRILKRATGPMGIESIASRLRQQEVTLEEAVEPFLLYCNFIERKKGGRIITEEGRQHLVQVGHQREQHP